MTHKAFLGVLKMTETLMRGSLSLVASCSRSPSPRPAVSSVCCQNVTHQSLRPNPRKVCASVSASLGPLGPRRSRRSHLLLFLHPPRCIPQSCDSRESPSITITARFMTTGLGYTHFRWGFQNKMESKVDFLRIYFFSEYSWIIFSAQKINSG